MKPPSWDKPLALPLEHAASRSGQANHPSANEMGLDVSHHTRISPRGGEDFFLDILFYRMSVTASRVENRRSDCSLPVDIRRGFRLATAVRFGLVLFPVPAHRTGLADFPHPALVKDSRFRSRRFAPLQLFPFLKEPRYLKIVKVRIAVPVNFRERCIGCFARRWRKPMHDVHRIVESLDQFGFTIQQNESVSHFRPPGSESAAASMNTLPEPAQWRSIPFFFTPETHTDSPVSISLM
jgi:hypothetical protein